jgi:molecular chaperone GrpE
MTDSVTTPLDSAPESLPAPEASATDALQKELDALKTQATEYRDGWQRERAEFANYKRRMEKEQADLRQNAAGRILARYLEVQDDFDRALQDQPAEGAAPETILQWASGVALINRKLQSVLEAEGVTRIDAAGQTFDPNLHEAVTHEDSPDHQSGQIIAVLRQGYKLGERVIRPALVRVAR